MMAVFDDKIRRLILAVEIAGLLHDLGKLHPGFAKEMLKGGDNLGDLTKKSCGIQAAHGAILEAHREYPEPDEMRKKPDLAAVLAGLLADAGWAETLAVPEEWLKRGAVQASGLGAALRQHHANQDFPSSQLSFLGDLYSFGADIRDSALDKASGGAEGGKQAPLHAEIADAFGQLRAPYSSESLTAVWDDVIAIIRDCLFSSAALRDVAATRRLLIEKLQPVFAKALGETRRPTNDVTLWHHAHSSASFFKAAVAEGALRADFKPLQTDTGEFDFKRLGRVRFRLLGIRWDWQALTRGMFTTTALISLSDRRREVVENLRELFEESSPVGNIIYEDDDGVLILAPGFHEEDAAESERRFARHLLDPLQEAVAGCLEPLGVGTPFRLCWSAPALYLTDYPEALGLDAASPRQRSLQAGEEKLRALWEAANAEQGKLMQICPQCGLRPAEAREYALTESGIRVQALCNDCTTLTDRDAKRARAGHLATDFGFRSSVTTIEELARQGGSSRVALISVQVDAGAIASGNALITQLARPLALIRAGLEPVRKQKKNSLKHKPTDLDGFTDNNRLGKWFNNLLDELRLGKLPKDEDARLARRLLGESFWLMATDGRSAASDTAQKALEVAEGFFLRESSALPEEWQLARHDCRDGDRLALFAMRKHASPARLQRLWDDLRDLWKELANEVAGTLDHRLLPLTLDARGLRFLVAATDADATVATIGRLLAQRLSKVRGGLAAHVSCAVMRTKFPLYLALDLLGRLDARVPKVPHQTWLVESTSRAANGRALDLVWSTPQGLVHWQVDTATGDPGQDDPWHPHVIAVKHAGQPVEGPQRLTHVRDLLPGDEALIPPMTFDFMVLEGSARRHQLAYRREDGELRRPHWVMGEAGRSPLLLEGFAEFSRLIKDSGWETSKVKGLQGEMVETYQKWLGDDVPLALRAGGRDAWHAHLRNMLLRYVTGDDAPARRDRLFNAILDGRFFDAVEWTTFVSKTDPSLSEENA